MISSEEDLSLIDRCKKQNIGLIAIKALSGGLNTNIPAAFEYFTDLGIGVTDIEWK